MSDPGELEAKPRVAFIGGPTASGKTGLAIALAERLGGEVISADSQQVYKGFDIGTAKPSAEQLARVPHHLVSYLDPRTEQTDAAGFERRAAALIAEIRARGRTPLVVGGTGLYLKALLFGVVPAPARNRELREQLELKAQREGRAAVHAELALKDPSAASRIRSNDLVRSIRALEIIEGTGRPASELWSTHGFQAPRFQVAAFLIEPPRPVLFERIDSRSREMFDKGLVEEVRGLWANGLKDAPPMKSLGYSQAAQVLEGRITLEQAVELTARATRHYAKRQITWFKKESWWSRQSTPAVEPLAGELERFFSSGR